MTQRATEKWVMTDAARESESARLTANSEKRARERRCSKTFFPAETRVEVEQIGGGRPRWVPGTVVTSRHNRAHDCVVVTVRLDSGETQRRDAGRVRSMGGAA